MGVAQHNDQMQKGAKAWLDKSGAIYEHDTSTIAFDPDAYKNTTNHGEINIITGKDTGNWETESVKYYFDADGPVEKTVENPWGDDYDESLGWFIILTTVLLFLTAFACLAGLVFRCWKVDDGPC